MTKTSFCSFFSSFIIIFMSCMDPLLRILRCFLYRFFRVLCPSDARRRLPSFSSLDT
jgi:hypothetical protein